MIHGRSKTSVMQHLLSKSILLLSLFAAASTVAETPGADVQAVIDRYRAAVPAEEDLAVYRLDWAPSLDAAVEKAGREQRPILLIVVTNSYGNLYSGHC
jgi:hypothetical protein